MTEQYPSTYDEAILTVENNEALRERLRVIQFDGAEFHTDPLEVDFHRAWISPTEGQFTDDQVAKLRCELSDRWCVDIEWSREFRKDEGTYYWRGKAKDMKLHEDNTAEVWLMIENTLKPKNCTVRQVEETRKVWVSDCEKVTP